MTDQPQPIDGEEFCATSRLRRSSRARSRSRLKAETGMTARNRLLGTRSSELPYETFREELLWFASAYSKPFETPSSSSIDDMVMNRFKSIIWDHPSRELIPEFGCTVEEMAKLCGQGPAGELLPCHIIWILDKINEAQDTTFCLFLGLCSPGDMMQCLLERSDTIRVEKLVFVASVRRDAEGTVSLVKPQSTGECHWVLITVELADQPIIRYCDSLGWNCPHDVLQVLDPFTACFGVETLQGNSVVMMHVPSSKEHLCTSDCQNYPFQTGEHVCGMVVLICAVVAALDNTLFAQLTGPRTGLKLYLHDPTKFERYLRRVLISWFMSGQVSMALVSQHQFIGPSSAYSVAPRSPRILRKKKCADLPQWTPKHAHYSGTTHQDGPYSQEKLDCRVVSQNTCSPVQPSVNLNANSEKCIVINKEESTNASKVTVLTNNPVACSLANSKLDHQSGSQVDTKENPQIDTDSVIVLNVNPASFSTTNSMSHCQSAGQKNIRVKEQTSASNLRSSIPTTVSCSIEICESDCQTASQESTKESSQISTGNQISIVTNPASHSDANSLKDYQSGNQASTKESAQKRVGNILILAPNRDSFSTANKVSYSQSVNQGCTTEITQTDAGNIIVLATNPVSFSTTNSRSAHLPANLKGTRKSAKNIAAKLRPLLPKSAACIVANSEQQSLSRVSIKEIAQTNGDILESLLPKSVPTSTANSKADCQSSNQISTKENSQASDNISSGSVHCNKTAHRTRKNKQVICPYCSAKLSSRGALIKHQERKHKEHKSIPQTNVLSCVCQNCPDFRAIGILDLISHYRQKHCKDINIFYKTFNDEEEFNNWKKEIERETSSRYVKSYGAQKGKHEITSHFYCSRSGMRRGVANPKRKRKSVKIGNKCTSFMTVRKYIADKTISVKYCLHHTGHSLEFGRQTLPDDLMKHITDQLAQGIDPGQIMDDIQDKTRQAKANSDTSGTRGDIHSIRNECNILHAQKHSEDCQSVDLWVQELQKEPSNPVIFYKAQGTSHNILKDDDFILCIQTEFQRNMMIRNGSKMICVDVAHKASQDELYLTTVLVLDDCEEAFPVAWAISNKEDSEILKLFMKGLKESCGQDFVSDVFMGDFAGRAYSAWCSIFSKSIKMFYCSWDGDERWRQDIFEHIHSQLDQCKTYAYMKSLQVEVDAGSFRGMLQEFFEYLDQQSPAFQEYFWKNFVNFDKLSSWAVCFRSGSHANIDIFATKFHHILEAVRAQNKRIDNLLLVLLKIARDKAVELSLKAENERLSHLLRQVSFRHNSAEDVINIERSSESVEEWSASEAGVPSYSVRKIKIDRCKCKLVCNECKTCVHRYVCTCAEFQIQVVGCKHIHAVQKLQMKSEDSQNYDFWDDLFDNDIYDLSGMISAEDNSELCQDIEELRKTALNTAHDVVELIKSTNDLSILQEILKSLRSFPPKSNQ